VIARDAALTDVAAALVGMEGRFTELLELVQGMSLNHVLFSGTVVIDADGTWELAWPVPFAAVEVENPTAAAVTVAAAPRGASAPVRGVGVHVIAPGGDACVNITGNLLALYGPAGAAIGLT